MKRIFWLTFLLGLIAVNTVAWFQAYHFTHFSADDSQKTRMAELGSIEKIKVMLLGVSNPRPENPAEPEVQFSTVQLEGHESLEAWYLPTDSARGTVIMHHGYTDKKWSLLPRAYEFQQLGYACLMVDFYGSGGSAGATTSVGIHEAKDVQAAYNFAKEQYEGELVIFGTSMGATAVMRAVSEFEIAPDKVIIECPFSTLLETTNIRFRNMGIPPFPLANILLIWGGIQNSFWPFDHQPVEYARNMKMPVLLIHGQNDPVVDIAETEAIFKNLNEGKRLLSLPQSAHGNYLDLEPELWKTAVTDFLMN